MFIGFYIIFPLMLHSTMAGFSAATYKEAVSYYNSQAANGISNFTSGTTANNIGTIGPTSSVWGSTKDALSYLGQMLYSMTGYPGPGSTGYGAVNGYIANFLGPPIIIIVEIAFSFIVALDFADILSDILGAPSLSNERLLGRLL